MARTEEGKKGRGDKRVRDGLLSLYMELQSHAGMENGTTHTHSSCSA